MRLTAGFLGSGFGDIGVESHAPRDPSVSSARVFGERKPPLHADSARFCDEAPARLAAFLARIIDEYEPLAGLAPFPVPFPPPRAMMDPSAAILKSFGSSNVEAAGFVPGLYPPKSPSSSESESAIRTILRSAGDAETSLESSLPPRALELAPAHRPAAFAPRIDDSAASRAAASTRDLSPRAASLMSPAALTFRTDASLASAAALKPAAPHLDLAAAAFSSRSRA